MDCLNYTLNALKHAALLLLAGVIPWIAVAFAMQLISNSIRKSLVKVLGIRGYVYLTCPGVVVHELGHAFFCLVFGHKIVEMKLFSPEEDGTLGYVNHSYDPRNVYHRIGNFFIGTGPVWFGTAVLWFISYLLLPEGIEFESNSIAAGVRNVLSVFLSPDFWQRWQSYLWLYIMLTVASHITLSPPDLSGSLDGGGIIIFAVVTASLLFENSNEWKILSVEFCKNLFFSSFSVFAFIIIILLIFSIICRIITWKK